LAAGGTGVPLPDMREGVAERGDANDEMSDARKLLVGVDPVAVAALGRDDFLTGLAFSEPARYTQRTTSARIWTGVEVTRWRVKYFLGVSQLHFISPLSRFRAFWLLFVGVRIPQSPQPPIMEPALFMTVPMVSNRC